MASINNNLEDSELKTNPDRNGNQQRDCIPFDLLSITNNKSNDANGLSTHNSLSGDLVKDAVDAQGCFGMSASRGRGDTGRRSPRLSVDRDAIDYSMMHANRGKCLIINNKNFNPSTQLNERKGTDRDAEALFDCFSNLNFEVEQLHDGTALEIKSKLRSLANEDFSQDDCLVVCVLTHGDRGVLWGRDHRYPTDDVYSYFTADKCPSLAGKPKVFLIQACQGSKFDQGTFVKEHRDEVDAIQYYKIPNWADLLIMYSTVPGYYSWRNPSTGSWFIQALCDVLGKHHTNMDLLSMLTLVNHKVAYQFESFCPGQGDFDGNKQVPCITSMLTRKVYFSSNVV